MSRSRTIEFFKGAVSTIVLQLIITLSGFITPRIMLTVYGSEINGIVSSLSQFINYFTLVEAGLGGTAIYALYKPLADDNHKKVNSILSAAKILYVKSGYVFVGLMFFLAFIFPIFTKITTMSMFEVFLLTLIIGMTGVLDFFTLSKYRVILTADQRVYVISLASAAFYILFTAIIWVVSLANVNIVIMRLLALGAILVRSLILFLYCKRTYHWLDFGEKPNYEAMKSKNDVLFQQITGMVQTGMPIILATFIIKDLKIVSVFSIYNMVLSGINGILGVFSISLASGFGNLIISGDKSLLKKTYQEFESIYLILITMIYLTTLFLLLPFVKLYTADVTDINYILPAFACLSVWNGVLYNVKTPLSMLVVSAGMYKETRNLNAVTALIIIVLGIPFTLFYGLNGIMLASIISNFYRTVYLIFFVHKKITEDSVRNTLFRIIRVLTLMAVATVLTFILKFHIDSVVSWILYSILIFVISMVVVVVSMGIFDKVYISHLVKRLKKIFLGE